MATQHIDAGILGVVPDPHSAAHVGGKETGRKVGRRDRYDQLTHVGQTKAIVLCIFRNSSLAKLLAWGLKGLYYNTRQRD